MAIKSKIAFAACAGLILMLQSAPSFAKTTAECEALFAEADTDKDGTLGKMEDPKWEQRIKHMTNMSKKDQDIIQKPQFMESCERGEMDGL